MLGSKLTLFQWLQSSRFWVKRMKALRQNNEVLIFVYIFSKVLEIWHFTAVPAKIADTISCHMKHAILCCVLTRDVEAAIFESLPLPPLALLLPPLPVPPLNDVIFA